MIARASSLRSSATESRDRGSARRRRQPGFFELSRAVAGHEQQGSHGSASFLALVVPVRGRPYRTSLRRRKSRRTASHASRRSRGFGTVRPVEAAPACAGHQRSWRSKPFASSTAPPFRRGWRLRGVVRARRAAARYGRNGARTWRWRRAARPRDRPRRSARD